MAENLFEPLSQELQHFLLASHAPKGRFWARVFDVDDDLGKLFLALSMEHYRFQVLEQKLYGEMNIREADELLQEWEESVGLPNECFTTNTTKTRRRQQVEQVFANFGGVQKKEDFIRVAAFFGFNISIITGTAAGTFPLEFPILFFSSTKAAKHSFFVILNDAGDVSNEFPLPFPIPFSIGGKQFLQCIFEALAPANVNPIIVNVGDI